MGCFDTWTVIGWHLGPGWNIGGTDSRYLTSTWLLSNLVKTDFESSQITSGNPIGIPPRLQLLLVPAFHPEEYHKNQDIDEEGVETYQ